MKLGKEFQSCQMGPKYRANHKSNESYLKKKGSISTVVAITGSSIQRRISHGRIFQTPGKSKIRCVRPDIQWEATSQTDHIDFRVKQE